MEEEGDFPKNMVTYSFEDGDVLRPKVRFYEKLIEELSQPSRESLVVKLLGLRLGYNAMREKLNSVWRPLAGFHFMEQLLYGEV